MRKVLLSLLFVFATINVSAQVTYNLRAGYGGVAFDTSKYDYGDTFVEHGLSTGFQANIPINYDNTLTFSPTLLLTLSDEVYASIPLYLGYKVPIGYRTIFFPKIGPVAHYGHDRGVGVSTELSFERKHLVFVANYSFIGGRKGDTNSVNITLGYKF